jgi:hypothetical protein
MNIWSALGNTLGEGLGGGISGGIQELVDRKTRKIQTKNNIKDLMDIGFNERQAQILASIPSENRLDAIKFFEQSNDPYRQLQSQSIQDISDTQRGVPVNQQLGQDFMEQLRSPAITRNVNQQDVNVADEDILPSQTMTRVKPKQAVKTSGKSVKAPFKSQEAGIQLTENEQTAPYSRVVQPKSTKITKENNSKSAKYNENITKKVDTARELLQIADEMESLIKSGKVLHGTQGAWAKRLNNWAGVALGDETGTFDSLGSQAAILEAGLIPGTTTNEKLKAAERTKPNITQSRKTQEARIKAMRKKAQDILNKYGSSDQNENVSFEGLPDAATEQGTRFQKDGITVESVNENGRWVWRVV